MLNKIKLTLTAVFAVSLFAAPMLAIVPNVQAQEIKNGLCTGANLSFTEEDCGDGQADKQGLNDLLADIINIISIIVGIVAVIMIIYGGFKYITSGGDSGNVTGAKNTILYAIIGLIIVALAQFIVKFVLNTGATAVNG